MGQRLLLAITLLIVARTVTFISPLPAETEAGNFDREPVATAPLSPAPPRESAPLGDSPDDIPIADAPATLNPWQDADPNSVMESVDPYPFSDRRDDNAQNPVESWEDPQQTFSSDARIPPPPDSATMTGVCETLKPAVVTVHAGREIGSGSIVAADGLVITNHHVVRRLQRADTLFVKTQDGNRFSGRVVASDRPNDLALIRLQTSGSLPTVPVATTAPPTVGETVCAIGSPFGRAGTITFGQLVRVLSNGDLQSDVELQPGNSGGPLINARGEMIGVNKGVARSRQNRSREFSRRDRAPQTSTTGQVSYATNSRVADGLIDQHRSAAMSGSERFRSGSE